MEDSNRRPNPLDHFYYTLDDSEAEDLTKYKRNGFHPVILGDVLPKPGTCVESQKSPQYQIFLKLGHGAFATVWLARDLVHERYVSIKVCVGTDAPDGNQEAAILSKIHSVGAGKPGCERIIQLFDAFTIEGPNGFHQCLVTEVVIPLTEPGVRKRCSWITACQILEVFAFLHGEDIAHGDPHLGNFGIALPQLEQFDDDSISEYFANPEISPVIPRDASSPLSSLPTYITPKVSLASFLKARNALPTEPTMSIKIFDFGRAHETNRKCEALPGGVPEMIRPPETLIYERSGGSAGSEWGKAADIWAIGCIIYRIICGGGVVSTFYWPGSFLFQTTRFGGPPPDSWLPFLQEEDINGNERTAADSAMSCHDRDGVWLGHAAGRYPCKDKREGLIDLLKKMIVTDPDKRCPAAELLEHPVFAYPEPYRVPSDEPVFTGELNRVHDTAAQATMHAKLTLGCKDPNFGLPRGHTRAQGLISGSPPG